MAKSILIAGNMASNRRDSPLLQLPQYQLLRKAVSENVAPLVILTGSGVSTPAGLPDWRNLRREIQTSLENAKAAHEYNGVEYDQFLFKDAVKTDDYWRFFQLAKRLLGPATFNEIIREKLDPQELEVPENLSSLMRLRPKGIVTLNLDRLSGMALAEAHPGTPINTIFGTQLSQRWNLLREEMPFLVHLHGHIVDSSTWVLDAEGLKHLTASPAHSLFLSTLFMDNTVLLVGVSADDIALSAPLLQLRKAGFEPHRLFWLTNRVDATTSAWAADNFVQVIQYKAASAEDHQENIDLLVSNISNYRSPDALPGPIRMATKVFNSKLKDSTPVELSMMAPDEVRKALSDLLEDRLEGLDGDQLYDKFFEFCEEYDFPIKTRAFYRHKKSASYFFDHKLQFPELGRGNFGVVYGARSPDGKDVAVKVMHDNILSTREMLGGFRRGSRSMQMLTRSGIQGVAGLIAAYEMPPTIIMELVPGNSLEELFSNVQSIPWATKARIGSEISRVVDQCHKLPEMILHRDIKPSNVILDGYDHTDGSYNKLVVLDFDMSWHKGSSEKDVVFESRDDFGYLAPEQTDSAHATSARSAKVDSYGLGMTLYALFSGRHPIPNIAMASGWTETLRRAVSANYPGGWICLPVRVSRAIEEATRPVQAERLDFSSLAHRLFRVCEALSSTQISSPDVFAEEVIARLAGTNWSYTWDDISDRGSLLFPGGFSIQVASNLETYSIDLNLSFNDPGGALYKRRDEMLRSCKSHLEQGFSSLDCRVKNSTVRAGYLSFSVSVGGSRDLKAAEDLAEILMGAMRPLREQG